MEKPKRLSKQDVAKLSDDDLKTYAAEHKIDLSSVKTREDAEAAVESHFEEVDKAEAEKASGKVKAAKREPLTEGDVAEVVQKVWAQFARAIPQPAISSGSYALTKEQRKVAEDLGMPDGDYRIIGADWILRFEKGRFVEAVRGGPNTDPESYVSVPAVEHR